MNNYDHLPAHVAPIEEAGSGAGLGDIHVSGLVWRSRSLSPAELRALHRTRLAEPFVCEEGWAVNDLIWEGVSLREALTLCQPLPEARYVRISSGSYSIALPLSDIDHALLCDQLNGEPLAREHGAPWRLVLSGGACFTSVKWVSALEFTAQPVEATAERIARARIAPQNVR